MYIPAHFGAGADAVQHLLTWPAAANLVTMTDQGLLATMLPYIYEPTVGERGALHAHAARNNPQFSCLPKGEALAIIEGTDAYISPSWYPSKLEHGRVVPTGTTQPPTSTAN
jgi:transcriptional regulator